MNVRMPCDDSRCNPATKRPDRDRTFGPVTDVAGQQQKRRILIDGQLNERIPGSQRRLAQRARDRRRGATNPLKWDIQMQVGCMNEAIRCR